MVGEVKSGSAMNRRLKFAVVNRIEFALVAWLVFAVAIVRRGDNAFVTAELIIDKGFCCYCWKLFFLNKQSYYDAEEAQFQYSKPACKCHTLISINGLSNSTE